MKPHDIKPVAKAPDIDHPTGKAWLVDIDAIRKHDPPPPPDATVAMWVVEAPWAHPVWHSYAIFLILHLRKMESEDHETLLYVDGGTHELHVYAMDPDADREGIILGTDAKYGRALLTPVNFCAQSVSGLSAPRQIEFTDTWTRALAASSSAAMNYLQKWVMLYGDNMMKDREDSAARPVIRRKG